MDKAELEQRTKRFALRVIGFVAELPKSKVNDVLGYQLLKSGTSIGANYREANRAESRYDFIHKIGVVERRKLLRPNTGSSSARRLVWEALKSANGYFRN